MWAQLINALLGVWLMAAPSVLQYGGTARTNDHIVGPIAACFAVVSLWEATRPLRWVNLLLGFWMILAPVLLGGYEPRIVIHSLVVGVLLGVFSSFRGKRTERFGGGWSSLWTGKGAAG